MIPTVEPAGVSEERLTDHELCELHSELCELPFSSVKSMPHRSRIAVAELLAARQQLAEMRGALSLAIDFIREEGEMSSLSDEKGRARETVIRECWSAINSWIKPGPLPGNGCDESAQRNGMVLATNVLMGMMVGIGPPSVVEAE